MSTVRVLECLPHQRVDNLICIEGSEISKELTALIDKLIRNQCKRFNKRKKQRRARCK